MIEMSYAHRMDFVNICRANPGKTSRQCFELWRDWLDETYGPLCVEIDGLKYPPGTWKSKPFKGSVLYKGETAAERRAILAGEILPDELQDDPTAQKQIDAWCERNGITKTEWRERVEAYKKMGEHERAKTKSESI